MDELRVAELRVDVPVGDLYELILQHASLPVLVSDLRGSIIAINPAGTALLGYDAQDAELSLPRVLLPIRDDVDVLPACFVDGTETTTWARWVLAHKDGSPITVAAHLTLFAHLGQRLMIAMLEDWTDRTWADSSALDVASARNYRSRNAGSHDAVSPVRPSVSPVR